MTTIAIRKYQDRIEIASDGIENDSGMRRKSKKIFSFAGLTFGYAGYADQALILANSLTLNNSFKNEKEVYNHFNTVKVQFHTDGESVECALIIFNQRMYYLQINKLCVGFTEIQEDIYATGNGRKYAIAAMDCGLSPKEAVKVAIKFDIFSGGEVQEEIIKFNKKA